LRRETTVGELGNDACGFLAGIDYDRLRRAIPVHEIAVRLDRPYGQADDAKRRDARLLVGGTRGRRLGQRRRASRGAGSLPRRLDAAQRRPRSTNRGEGTISMIIEQSELRELPEVQRLIEVGLERGSLTMLEVGEALTDIELDAVLLEEVYRELESHGVELLEGPAPVDEKTIAPRVVIEGTTDSLQLFLQEVGRYPLLTKLEEIQLAKRVEQGDMIAKRRMIESNLRLVVSIAKNYPGQRLAFLDLIP